MKLFDSYDWETPKFVNNKRKWTKRYRPVKKHRPFYLIIQRLQNLTLIAFTKVSWNFRILT